MDMIDLNVFQMVTRKGTLTKAARKLAMTQPGVTQHIKKLEEELGRRLFEREKGRLVLNDFGRSFLVKTENILKEFNHLKSFSEQKTETVGTLKIGLTDASTQTIIPPILKKFRDKYSNVHLELVVSDSGKIEDGVIGGRYDLGVISAEEKPHPLLEEHFIGHDRIDCLVSNKHPLARYSRISLEKLVENPLILYPKDSRTRRIIDTVLRNRGLLPTEILDVSFNSAAVRLAEAGLGVAFLSRYFIDSELVRHKCKHLRIVGDPFKRNICVIRKKNEKLADPAYRFYKLLMER